jgi:flavodoxin/NAD-dependent dihydropyrimidine dehydrogenase PreA subunit
MKCIVVYDSQTGNTRKVAEAIHRGMGTSGEQCEIAHIRRVSSKDLAGYDLIGLGSPVWWQREPKNITNFIEYGMESAEGKHAFAFCTHGAFPAHYFSRVVPALRQNGLTVVGWKDWFGSCVFPVIPKPYFSDGHPDEIDLKEAEAFGAEMVNRSRRIYQGEIKLIPTLPTGNAYTKIYDPIAFNEPNVELDALKFACDKVIERTPFTINKEKCRYPKCSSCMDNCPMGAIDLSLSEPFFNRICDRCYLCEQSCPNSAIEMDYVSFQVSHDPFVPFLEKSFEAFEAMGRFRRLTPIEKIGRETPMWTLKRPRVKITKADHGKSEKKESK